MKRHELVIIAVVALIIVAIVTIVRVDADDASASKAPTGAKCGGPYVGLSTEEAIRQAEAADAPWRIGSEDGKPYPATLDYDPTRATFDINGGTVTSAVCG